MFVSVGSNWRCSGRSLIVDFAAVTGMVNNVVVAMDGDEEEKQEEET